MHRIRWLAITILPVFGVFAAFLGAAPEKAEAQSYEAAEVEAVGEFGIRKRSHVVETFRWKVFSAIERLQYAKADG